MMCVYHIYCSRDIQRGDCREAEIRYRNGRRKGNKLSLLAQHYLFLFCHVNLTLCKYIFMPIKEQLDPFYYNYTRYCMHVFKQHLSADSVIGFVKQFSEILISIGNLSISFDINSRKISARS